MVVRSDVNEPKNDCADEGQHQFTGLVFRVLMNRDSVNGMLYCVHQTNFRETEVSYQRIKHCETSHLQVR
jgi:hypothetical protein